MNKDTVVGILGAVILVAAMVAIFYYEGTQAPGGAANPGGPLPPGTSFREASAAGAGAQGQGTGGTPTEGDVMVNTTNVTAVEFTLTWTDDVGDPTAGNANNDQFTITIRTPDNRTLPAVQSSNGTAVILVRPLCAVPNGTLPAGPCTTGTGRYHYTVEVTPQGATPIPSPIPGLPVDDTGNAFAIATRVSSYQAVTTGS